MPKLQRLGYELALTFLLRFYRVWNVEQRALPQAALDKLLPIETHQHDPIEAAEKIIAGMPNRPEIQYGGSQSHLSIWLEPEVQSHE